MDVIKFLKAVQNYDGESPEMKKFIEENSLKDNFSDNGMDDFTWFVKYDDKNFDGIPLGVVYEHGGVEGAGEEYYVVFSHGDDLIRVDGYYNSWEGGELDGDIYKVEKVPVEAFDYRRISS